MSLSAEQIAEAALSLPTDARGWLTGWLKALTRPRTRTFANYGRLKRAAAGMKSGMGWCKPSLGTRRWLESAGQSLDEV